MIECGGVAIYPHIFLKKVGEIFGGLKYYY